jgi:hypothetical protein
MSSHDHGNRTGIGVSTSNDAIVHGYVCTLSSGHVCSEDLASVVSVVSGDECHVQGGWCL